MLKFLQNSLIIVRISMKLLKFPQGVYAVADPEFPRWEGGGGVRQPQTWRQKPIFWSNFPRKLHENERNWTRGGGGGSRRSASLALPWIRQYFMLKCRSRLGAVLRELECVHHIL